MSKSEECRRRAGHSRQHAQYATCEEVRRVHLQLAGTWERLAREIERQRGLAKTGKKQASGWRGIT
jgi:hypothetical protein